MPNGLNSLALTFHHSSMHLIIFFKTTAWIVHGRRSGCRRDICLGYIQEITVSCMMFSRRQYVLLFIHTSLWKAVAHRRISKLPVSFSLFCNLGFDKWQWIRSETRTMASDFPSRNECISHLVCYVLCRESYAFNAFKKFIEYILTA